MLNPPGLSDEPKFLNIFLPMAVTDKIIFLDLDGGMNTRRHQRQRVAFSRH